MSSDPDTLEIAPPEAEDNCGRTPPGTRIYAVGDIHGEFTLLRHMHEAIYEDAARNKAERRVVVYLGDYIDRGPDSRSVLEYLCKRPLRGFETVFLRGNHETMLLSCLRSDGAMAAWYFNGGNATAASYDVLPCFEDEVTPSPDTAISFRRSIPDHHLEFLNATRFYHQEGGYVFVHAGIRPGIPLEEQLPDDLMWIREPFLSEEGERPFVVVHGHTPMHEPDFAPYRIGIDTGAFATGRLTCLVLDGADRQLIFVDKMV